MLPGQERAGRQRTLVPAASQAGLQAQCSDSGPESAARPGASGAGCCERNQAPTLVLSSNPTRMPASSAGGGAGGALMAGDLGSGIPGTQPWAGWGRLRGLPGGGTRSLAWRLRRAGPARGRGLALAWGQPGGQDQLLGDWMSPAGPTSSGPRAASSLPHAFPSREPFTGRESVCGWGVPGASGGLETEGSTPTRGPPAEII